MHSQVRNEGGFLYVLRLRSRLSKVMISWYTCFAKTLVLLKCYKEVFLDVIQKWIYIVSSKSNALEQISETQ